MRPIIFAPLLGLCLTAGLSLPAKAQFVEPTIDSCRYNFVNGSTNMFYATTGYWCLTSARTTVDSSDLGGYIEYVKAEIELTDGYLIAISKISSASSDDYFYIFSIWDTTAYHPINPVGSFTSDAYGNVNENSFEGDLDALAYYTPLFTEGLSLIKNTPLGASANPF